MKVLVVGATGGSGRAAVAACAAAGHTVTAFARSPGKIEATDRVRPFQGDAMNPEEVDRAVAGQDVVIVTLGITENPLRVRFMGPAHTPSNVRSEGTRNVMDAMRRHGVTKLIVQSSYGVGTTRDRLRFVDRLFIALLLKPQFADTETQERAVRESGLDWVIAQPVHLTDEVADEMPFVSTQGDTGRMQVSRGSVGRFLADAVTNARLRRHTVALSGTPLTQ